MRKTAPANPKPMPFGLLLLISFAVFNLGYIVDQTIRWSAHRQGHSGGKHRGHRHRHQCQPSRAR